MTQVDIENEVNARVEFKMKELLTACQNTAQNNWNAALHSGNPKFQHYNEAFKQFAGMVRKEMVMATPYNEMHQEKLRVQRDLAVDKLSHLLIDRHDRQRHPKVKSIVNAIEEIQRGV